MSTIKIKGGKPLNGTIEVRGAKNAVSKEMVAAPLTDQKSILRNISLIEDVEVVKGLIEAYGGEVKFENHNVEINPAKLHPVDPEKLSIFGGKSRLPILFCGPILHRLGEVVIPTLGGCNIGPRPINFHLDALRQMGAETIKEDHVMRIKAERLHGAKIKLEYPSVMTTEQILLAAVLAEGVTEVSNAAVEPEIMDLIMVLQKMGAVISVDTDRVIKVIGVNKLSGHDHIAIPDRIEAASWACIAAATNGKIVVKGARRRI